MKAKLDGYALRVPTPNVSVVNLTVMTEKLAQWKRSTPALGKAAEGPMKGILALSDEELVSVDFRGNSNSAIVDVPHTRVGGRNCVKVVAWYDNEWGFSCGRRDLVELPAKSLRRAAFEIEALTHSGARAVEVQARKMSENWNEVWK